MRKIFISIFIILCINIASLIVYQKKTDLSVDNDNFLKKLDKKIKAINGNEKIYGELTTLLSIFAETGVGIFSGLAVFFMHLICLAEIIVLNIIFFLQICKKCCKIGRAIVSLLLLLICMCMAIYNLKNSFKVKHKLDLPDEEIYIFDDEFNNEIKERLKIIYETKIYLITCSFVWLIGMVAQFVLIILDVKNSYSKKKKNNNKNNNSVKQEVIVYQDSERHRNISEVAENTKQDILQNKNHN